MCQLQALKITGIFMGTFITLVGMGTEGFYAWKVYELGQCVSYPNDTVYIPCLDSRNQSDVCYHDDLELRSYIGLTEGIFGTIVSICFIIGYVFLNLPLLWIWVVWALGITSYNAYCIYDYFTTMQDFMIDCIDSSQFWDIFIDQDYAYFFVTVTASVCCYALTLLVTVPVISVITHMYKKGNAASYELRGYMWDNDAFEME